MRRYHGRWGRGSRFGNRQLLIVVVLGLLLFVLLNNRAGCSTANVGATGCADPKAPLRSL
jgi:hypothetical protein